MRAIARPAITASAAALKTDAPNKRKENPILSPTASHAVLAGHRPVLCERPDARALGKPAINAGKTARDRIAAAMRPVKVTARLASYSIQSASQRADKPKKRAITP